MTEEKSLKPVLKILAPAVLLLLLISLWIRSYFIWDVLARAIGSQHQLLLESDYGYITIRVEPFADVQSLLWLHGTWTSKLGLVRKRNLGRQSLQFRRFKKLDP